MASGAELRARLGGAPSGGASGASLRARIAGAPEEEEPLAVPAFLQKNLGRPDPTVGREAAAQRRTEQELIEEQRAIDAEADQPLLDDLGQIITQALTGATEAGAGLANFSAGVIELFSSGKASRTRRLQGLPPDPSAPPVGEGPFTSVTRPIGEAFVRSAEGLSGPAVTPAGRVGRIIGNEALASLVTTPAMAVGGRAIKVARPTQKLLTRTARTPTAELVRAEALATAGSISGQSLAQESGADVGGQVSAGLAGAIAPGLRGSVVRGGREFFGRFRGAASRREQLDAMAKELRAGDFKSISDGRLRRAGDLAADRMRDQAVNRKAGEAILDGARAERAAVGLPTRVDANEDLFVLGGSPGLDTAMAGALSNNPDVALVAINKSKRGHSAMAEEIDRLGGAPGLTAQETGSAVVETRMRDEMNALDGRVRDELEQVALEPGDVVNKQRAISESTARELEQLNNRFETRLVAIHDEISDLGITLEARWQPDIMKQAAIQIRNPQRVPGGRFPEAGVGVFEQEHLPEAILTQIEQLGPDTPWHALDSLKRQINGKIRDPNLSPEAKRPYGVLKDAFEQTLDDMSVNPDKITFARGQLESVVPGTAVLSETERIADEAFQRLNMATKMRNASQYTRDGKTLLRDGIAGVQLSGNSNGPNHALLSKYFNGTKRNADEFVRVFGGGRSNPAMKEARDYLIADAYRFSLVDVGEETFKISREKMGKWLAAQRPVLAKAEFAEVKRAVTDAKRLVTEARKIGVPAANDGITIANNHLRLYVTAPNRLWNALRNSPNPVRDLDTLMKRISKDGTPEALEGLMRKFWDDVVIRTSVSGGKIPRVDAAALDKVLRSSGVERRLLERLYSPGQLNQLERISTAVKQIERIPSRVSTTAADIPTIGQDVSRGIEQAGAFSTILGPGRRGARAVRAGSRFLNSISDAQAERIFEEAVINEDLARLLLARQTESTGREIHRIMASTVPTMFTRVSEREERRRQTDLQRSRARVGP